MKKHIELSKKQKLIIKRTLGRFDDIEIPDSPPESLGLLDEFRKNNKTGGVFDDVDALFIQHHLGPFVPRMAAMVDDALSPGRCWFVDIPYSTNLDARTRLHELKFPKYQATELFNDPLVPYSKTQIGRVTDILRSIANRKNARKLLVVDDGAYFLRALRELQQTEPELVETFRYSRVVEQTTRGHRFLMEWGSELIDHYEMPVVSIARCGTKTLFESPFIGAAVSRAINNVIDDSVETRDQIERIAVLGFGPVGKNTTEALRGKYSKARIDVIEPEKRKHKFITGDRVTPKIELPERLQEGESYNLVAGCTGYNSFKLHQRFLLSDNALLASGSSAAVEFNRAGFIELADAFPDDEIEVLNREETKRKGIHAPITLQQEKGKRLTFINAGFPVNFDGKIECLPPLIIQATHCLLYAASKQALQAEYPGLRSIDLGYDTWILDNAVKELEENS